MQLIVANQTLGGTALEREVAARIERGARRFHVLVPMTAPVDETQLWAVADVGFALLPPEIDPAEALAEAEQRSRYRLDRMIEKVENAGGTATGEIGQVDPIEAIRGVLDRGEPDGQIEEIIISTLPIGLSRWVKLDLPSRVARLTDLPITTVEADA
jgi:hypothetical protein